MSRYLNSRKPYAMPSAVREYVYGPIVAMPTARALTLRAEPEVSAVPVSVAIAGESK